MPLPPLAHNVSDPSKLSPLDWSNYFENKQQLAIGDTTFNVYSSGLTNTGAIFVFHHGAGHSGLTFGLAAKYIFDHCPELCTVVAPDCRNHGDTTGENQENLNLDQMVDDLVNVFERMFPDNTRDIVLVGHSMGGAVVAHVAKSKRLPHILGLALVDIVEGSAMDSLPSIPMFISQRPQSFKTVESAIAWHIDSEAIHNPESARLSVPSLIRRFD
ncbi:Protein phosphatase methylesterase 1, partial [Linderina macrospora]